MSREAFSASAQTVTMVGAFGLFLPSLEKAWDADPGNVSPQLAKHIDRGEKIYLGLAVTAGTLQSLGSGSILPLLFALGIAGLVLFTYEHALSSEPGGI